ncbi:MAG: dephospho-CoA kinase [Endomicrobium sp.]|jgi:dephospho-CoA kinase|nr:dephospho-CoA kinase [Endomicrobium sp.]
MIVGLTGFCCSGKDTVANYISKKYGYTHYSLSDIIRRMMREDGVDLVRENFIAFGTRLREQNGNGVLAKKVLEKVALDGRYCITSIRHPDEVKELRIRKDFVLVSINSPQFLRFKRMQNRKRLGDPNTLEKFIELEDKESQEEGSGQQLKKTAGMADVNFVNDSNDVVTLEIAIERLLIKYLIVKNI